eukprot:jgi/Bigna1/68236/fgenesh1_pg.5_\
MCAPIKLWKVEISHFPTTAGLISSLRDILAQPPKMRRPTIIVTYAAVLLAALFLVSLLAISSTQTSASVSAAIIPLRRSNPGRSSLSSFDLAVRLRGGFDANAAKSALDSVVGGSNSELSERFKRHPELIDQFSKIIADPEIQGVMLKPGMMEKMAQFMSAGANVENCKDPEVKKLAALMARKIREYAGDFPDPNNASSSAGGNQNEQGGDKQPTAEQVGAEEKKQDANNSS